MLQSMVIPMFFFFMGLGAWLLICDLCPAPSRAVRAAVAGYHRKEKNSRIKELTAALAGKLLPFVHIGKYKRIRMENTLRSAHIKETPEEYLSKALANALINGVFWVALGLLLSPMLGLFAVGYCVFLYRQEARRADKAVKKKRELIDLELPHLANTITQELRQGRDVVRMLTSYSAVCGDLLKMELEITLADMATGVRKDALQRLSNRVGSLGLAQICRGLQSVMDGHDERSYFQTTAARLEMMQDQQTERFIQTLFIKIKPYSIGVLCCMIAILLVAVVLYVQNGI